MFKSINHSVCVWCVCMNIDLQLGRHNNYKCIWNPTALMLSIIAFSSKLQERAWNHVFSFVLWGQIGTVLERLQQSSRKLPWNSLTYLCVCVCLCVQEFHLTVHDVGGMVAQWLVLLPPKSFHVSPKFHRQARQVDERLNVLWLKVLVRVLVPCVLQPCDVLINQTLRENQM